MGYNELVSLIQREFGFNGSESEEALTNTVEAIAERLPANERKEFASQLPEELQEVALSAELTSPQEDIVEDFMETYDLPEEKAKKLLLAGWSAIKQAISLAELWHIQAQMPKKTLQILH